MKKQLSKSEIKELNDKLAVIGLKDFFDKKDRVEVVKDHETHQEFIEQNSQIVLFFHEGVAYPTVKLLLKRMILPQVVVDMGAVKFIIAGADLMRPGIKSIEKTDLPAKTIVVIVDENNKRPLAVGELLFSSEDIMKMEKGKAVKNLHYVGDMIWSHEA